LLNLVRILQPNLSWFFYIEEDFSGRFWFYLILFWSNLTSTSTFSLNFTIYLRFLLIWENDWGMKAFLPPQQPTKEFLLMLIGLGSCSLISYLFWLFYFDLSHWFCWILLRFWSWQFDHFCQTERMCCIKAVILTVCTVWLLAAAMLAAASKAAQLYYQNPPKS